MAVSAPAAYGMYADDIALRDVVQTLNQSGFDKEDICMMVSPQHPIAATVREGNIPDAGREASAAAAWTIGWLMKFGAVMIPTVGLFVRSEPFLHALLAKKDSPAAYGNSKTLAGLGFCESDALRFECQLRKAGVLLYVACPERAEMARAVEVLRKTGARETSTLQRAAAQSTAA